MSAATLGLIAGAGTLPALVMDARDRAGLLTYVMAIEGAAEPARFPRPPDVWVGLGEAIRSFDLLKAAGIRHLVMAGSVRRPKLVDLKPDLRVAGFLARVAMRALGDDTLLRAVVAEIESEGFHVMGLKEVAPELMAPLGPIGRLDVAETMKADVVLGFAAARALGVADRGQAVVVAGGRVVAEEDETGTDALIGRAAGNARAVLIKCRKPKQDERLDLPAIGPETVEACRRAGFAGVVVEAGETIVIDRAKVAAAADAAGLFVVGAR